MSDELARIKNQLINVLDNLDSSNVDIAADLIEAMIDEKIAEAVNFDREAAAPNSGALTMTNVEFLMATIWLAVGCWAAWQYFRKR